MKFRMLCAYFCGFHIEVSLIYGLEKTIRTKYIWNNYYTFVVLTANFISQMVENIVFNWEIDGL